MFNFMQMFKMMGNLHKIGPEVEQYRARLATLTAEGDAGAGMVRARVNGQMQVTELHLSEDAVKGGDREMLEDLIKAATNQALENIRALIAEETAKMATALGLPPGMSIPGLS